MAVPKSLINQKDLDHAVVNFEKVVKNVVDNGDGIQQAKLLKKLKDLAKFMLSTKDPKSVETMEIPPNKTIKINSSSSNMEIPNEIWLKIMNYLPTEDIFLNFACLNKRLNGLTKDSKALKYLSLQFKSKEAMKILKRSTGLVGLRIKQISSYSDWVEITKQVSIEV